MAIFEKRKLREKDKEKWSKVMTKEFMSSEESGDENNSVIVRPLPWRSNRVDSFFQSLDKSSLEGKSPQSLRQMKKRVIGEVSSRSKPDSHGLPSWAFD